MCAIDTTRGGSASSVLAAIGLGSNVGDSARALDDALEALAGLGPLVAVSSRYRTLAWGVREQPDFLNAVALLETSLAPRSLLAALKEIEVRLGRVATYRWGPRAIDLDILTYGDTRTDEPDLTIPHRMMLERAFVLVPLAEIAPAFAAARDALGPEALAEVARLPEPGRSEPTEPRSRRVVDWNQTLERVRIAAEFCSQSGLARLKVEDDDLSIEIRRAPRKVTPPAPVVPPPVASGASTNGAAPASRDVVLKAEFVGIVRFAHPAVVEGARLTAPREVAYVESLGIRNPIRATTPGRVSAIFVTDGQPVEFGQPLFSIEPDH